ncbi:MAG: M48 family metalloprotease, partial [Gammaproteobacteria bacterium]
RDKDGLPVMLVALALVVIGYVGLFFGRWIKSSVSRSREYLADASAVQFTRDPAGISGALKKIAVDGNASYLGVDTEEVGHMLFGPGQAMHLFATHPPLLQRIGRLDPGFREEQLHDLAARMKRERERSRREAEREAERSETRRESALSGLDPAGLIGQIGTPDFERLLLAAAVAASLPDPVRHVARSDELAPELLLYSLLHADAESRERQLLAIAETLGAESEERVRRLASAAGLPGAEQRLPLLELALPSLRRHPPERVHRLLSAIDRVIRADDRIDAFEYLMARMVRQFLWESANPHRVRPAGRKPLSSREEDVVLLLAVLALHGQRTDREEAEAAFAAGMEKALGRTGAALPEPGDWVAAMDRSLERLDALAPDAKRTLVEALMVTVTHDQRLIPAELELMRAAAAGLHVPVPVLTQPVAAP